MHLFHVSLGGGISGIETLLLLVKKIYTIQKTKKNKKKVGLLKRSKIFQGVLHMDLTNLYMAISIIL